MSVTGEGLDEFCIMTNTVFDTSKSVDVCHQDKTHGTTKTSGEILRSGTRSDKRRKKNGTRNGRAHPRDRKTKRKSRMSPSKKDATHERNDEYKKLITGQLQHVAGQREAFLDNVAKVEWLNVWRLGIDYQKTAI